MTLNPNQFQLFHGTTAFLNKGDTIKPNSSIPKQEYKPVINPTTLKVDPAPLEKTNYDVAFATPNIDNASAYAHRGMLRNQTLFAPVYSVEGDDAEKQTWSSDDTFESKKGFKVNGVARWVTHNDNWQSNLPKYLQHKEK